MTSSVIKKKSIWERVTIGTNTYGVCIGYKNTNLQMACVRWFGNSNIPPSEGYNISFNLPSGFLPIDNNVVPVRHGDNMEVRIDGEVHISITSYWSGATMMYPTQS